MVTTLVPKNENVVELVSKAQALLSLAKSPNTIRAYKSDWQNFQGWCGDHGLDSLPASAETICLFLTANVERLKPASLQRHLASIGQAHQAAGHDSPSAHILVRNLMAGIRRQRGVAQQGKSPILIDDLRSMILALPASSAGVRDKAILLLGFASACRRGEIVALNPYLPLQLIFLV